MSQRMTARELHCMHADNRNELRMLAKVRQQERDRAERRLAALLPFDPGVERTEDFCEGCFL